MFDNDADSPSVKRYDPKTGQQVTVKDSQQVKVNQGMPKKLQQLADMTHYAKIAKLVNQFEMAGTERSKDSDNSKQKKKKPTIGQQVAEPESEQDETRNLPPTEVPFANNFKKLVNYPTPNEIAAAELRLNDGPLGDRFALEKSLESVDKPLEEIPQFDILKFHKQQSKRMMLNPAYAAEALQGLKIPARTDRDFADEVKVAVDKEAVKIQRGVSEQEWDKPLRLRDFYQNLQRKKMEIGSNSKKKSIADYVKSPLLKQATQSQPQTQDDYSPVTLNKQDGQNIPGPNLSIARPLLAMGQPMAAIAKGILKTNGSGGSPSSANKQNQPKSKTGGSQNMTPMPTKSNSQMLPTFAELVAQPKSLVKVGALLHRLNLVRESSRPFLQTGIRVDWSDPFSKFGQSSRHIHESQFEEHSPDTSRDEKSGFEGQRSFTELADQQTQTDNLGELRPRVDKHLESYHSGRLRSGVVGLDNSGQSSLSKLQPPLGSQRQPPMFGDDRGAVEQQTPGQSVNMREGDRFPPGDPNLETESNPATPIRRLYLMLDLLVYSLGQQKIPFLLIKDSAEMARITKSYIEFSYQQDYGWCDKVIRFEQDLKRAHVTLESIVQERNVMGRAARELGYMKWLREKVLNWIIQIEDSGLLEDEGADSEETKYLSAKNFASFSQQNTGILLSTRNERSNQSPGTEKSVLVKDPNTKVTNFSQHGVDRTSGQENNKNLSNLMNTTQTPHQRNTNSKHQLGMSASSMNNLSPIKPILKKSPGRSLSNFMEDTPNKSSRSTNQRKSKWPDYPTISPVGHLHSALFFTLEKGHFPFDVPSVRRKVAVKATGQAKLEMKIAVQLVKVLTSTLLGVVAQNIPGVYILELKNFTELKAIPCNSPVSMIDTCRLLDEQEEDERVCQKYLIVGTVTGTVMMCSLYSLEVVAVFQAHLKPVLTMFDTCYGKGILTADGFGNLRIWNVLLGKKVDLSQSFSIPQLINSISGEKVLDLNAVSVQKVCFDRFGICFPRGIFLFRTKESVVNTITTECVAYFQSSLMGNPRIFNSSSAFFFFMDGVFYEYVLYEQTAGEKNPKLLALHKAKDTFGTYTQCTQTLADGYDLILEPNSMLKIRRTYPLSLIPEESESHATQTQVVFSGIDDEFLTVETNIGESAITLTYREPRDY